MRRTGFTYLEAILMIGVVFVVAMLIMPNVLANQRSKANWSFFTRLRAMAMEARSESIDRGRVAVLTYDKTAKAVKLLEENPDTGSSEEIRALALPADLVANKFSADKDQASDDQWRVPFFPDGTSAGGGIEFRVDDAPISFAIAREDGKPIVVNGQFPDLSQDRWPAGGYEPRT